MTMSVNGPRFTGARMRRFLLAIVLLGLVGVAAYWIMTRPQVITASDLPAHKPNLDNGKVMFFAGGCTSCHATPKQDDRRRLGGGLALAAPPYGTFYPPNISPDPSDEIGSWTDRRFTPDPNRPAEWNRGAYLVNGPGHCAECHSPRNALGAIVEDKRFIGGPNPEGEGTIPNITQHGIGEYSVKVIERILETGETPDDTVGGAMLAVVRSTSQLPQSDRAAIAAYIKSLPPVE
jgi:mono/diheme cytochrome c family protein